MKKSLLNKNSLYFFILLFVSLALRLWISLRLDFKNDQWVLFNVGKRFYETGEIPAEGIRLVYTSEALPGSLLGLLSGLPLFITQGDPVGLIYFISILNWLALCMFFLYIKKIIPKWTQLYFLAWILFAPWTVLFTSAWNVSYLPIFTVPFFGILEKNRKGDFSFVDSFLLGVLFIMCFQIHLSFVLFGIAFLLVLSLVRNRIRFVFGISSGSLFASIMLIPWVLNILAGHNQVPNRVLQFNIQHLLDFPKTYLRYVSFPTAEISRFASAPGQGFAGMLRMLGENLYLIPFSILAFLGSTFLMLLFFKRMVMLWKKNHLDLFERLELFLPIIMPLTFVFSLKSASAHTFWILMPLSFYSCIFALQDWLSQWSSKKKLAVIAYIVSASVFSVGGYLAANT